MQTSMKALIVGSLTLLPRLALASEWNIDPSHTTAGFAIRHMMVNMVHGKFDKVAGTLQLDEQNPTRTTLEVQIDAASIDTNEPKRDAHLKSADFFDVAKFPSITFKSTKVE